jgi:SAM-dependent methyltransferase
VTEPNAYDEFEYPGYSFPDTHPDRLWVMAALHGLTPAPVESCRVLEIGCGEGANLIPMAQALPRGEFTGFDLAALPIQRGQERTRALRLANLRLFQADLMDVGAETDKGELGQYDYVIAHGLYAWVPEPVRDRLLAVCSEHLAPGGVAFVSYNAYPGSHIRNMVRDVLGWTGNGRPEGEDRIATGLDLLEALISVRPGDDPYRRLFDEQLAKMRRRARNTTFHDELSPAYQPVWFSAFIRHARSHGLDFLTESELPVPSDPCFRPDLLARVKEVAGDDPIAQEDMLDFSRMRMYRETLLVRAGQPVQRELQAARLRQLRFASSAVSAPGDSPGQQLFALQGGVRVASDQPPAIAVMERLIDAWPCTLSYDETCRALAQGGLPPGADPARLLLQMAIARMIELHAWQPKLANRLSERPRIPESCRLEAAQRPYTANLWHGTVQLDDPVVRKLLLLADGTRTRDELLGSLAREFPEVSPAELESGLEENLERFRRAALLIA